MGFKELKRELMNEVCEESGISKEYLELFDTNHKVIMTYYIIQALVIVMIADAVLALRDGFVFIFQAFTNLFRVS